MGIFEIRFRAAGNSQNPWRCSINNNFGRIQEKRDKIAVFVWNEIGFTNCVLEKHMVISRSQRRKNERCPTAPQGKNQRALYPVEAVPA